MSVFSSTYEDLAEDFRCRGISVDSPGFCDSPSFFEVERGNPDYLNHYAAFVAKRPYDPSYLARAKVINDNAVSRLHAELNHPRQSRGLIIVSPSKGHFHESPKGDYLSPKTELLIMLLFFFLISYVCLNNVFI